MPPSPKPPRQSKRSARLGGARANLVQASIYEISEAASSATSLDELFRAIHVAVSELMPAHNFYIALHDASTGLLSFPYFVDEVDAPPAPRPLSRGGTEYVLRTGMPLLASPEVAAELERAGEIELIGSPSIDWLGVPLKTQDSTFGVLVVQSYTEGVRYTEEDEAILMFVSRQVAMAIARTRAEQALRESEERYRRLVELAPDGIAIHQDGVLVFCNETGARLLGFSSSAEAIGLPALNFVHPDDRPAVVERIRNALLLGEPQAPCQERFVRADGSTIIVEVAATPFTFGGRAAVMVVIHDVSLRVRLEEHVRHMQKMDAIGRLAGGVAHDFNNLLQALLSTVEVLKVRGASPEEMATTAAELEAHVKRGAALTRQLLLFARREVVKPERVDLNRVVAEATNLLRRLVRENIRLTLAPSREPLLLDADWGQLEQVLVNLVVNATDAMPAGGDLLISTGKVGDAEVWLEVGDTGIGIPEAVRERIFEPFFSTKPAEHGTGLGLAVVHGIVEQHRGRLEVRSAVGRGSTFRVILPCASGSAAPVSHRAEPSTTKQGRGERVLVVEDEEGARKALKEIIEMLGFQVTVAGSGEEAEAIGRAEPFDVLLTDFVLPGIDGAALARRLRDATPGLRVILMSGYAEDDGVRASVSSGSTHFLQKPFDVNTLSRTLWLALE